MLTMVRLNSTVSGVLTAILASSCCTIPLISTIFGSVVSLSSASPFLAAVRPYMIMLTLFFFGYAFYKAYMVKPKDCCAVVKPKFYEKKSFLWVGFIIALFLNTSPYWLSALTPKSVKSNPMSNERVFSKVSINISGMSCEACEGHIAGEISKLPGIGEYAISYPKGNAIVVFDSTKISISKIVESVNQTGYPVTNYELK